MIDFSDKSGDLRSLIIKKEDNFLSFISDLKPNYSKVYFHIGFAFSLVFLSLAFSSFIESLETSNFLGKFLKLTIILLLSFFLGFLLHYLTLFAHEAVHFNIHPNKKKNDLIANILICWINGDEIKKYRKIHLKHHRDIGTVNDSESSYFNKLDFKFILKSLSGLYVLDVFKKRKELLVNDQIKIFNLFYGILIHLLILYLFLNNEFYLTALAWLLAVSSFFPFLATVRQILEHRNPNKDNSLDYSNIDHGSFTRIFDEGLFARTFGGAGFNKHLLHHWEPTISYTNFGELEKFYNNIDTTKHIFSERKTSYVEALKKLK